MNRGISCCYKCTDREVGCHSKCEKYIQERRKLDEKKAEKACARPMYEYMYDRYMAKLKKYIEYSNNGHHKKGV